MKNVRVRILALCAIAGISATAYYKKRRSVHDQSAEHNAILRAVAAIRSSMPRTGGRKLLHNLPAETPKIGRDRFFRLLDEHGLLVRPRRQYVRTTNSSHHFFVHDNLVKSMSITKPERAFAADITYIDTDEGHGYLALITDMCSRKIVGNDFSDSLSLDGSMRALKMALRTVRDPEQLTHHSDRGVQYCSHPYTNLLRKHGVNISMAEAGNPYENALAERVNGILKNEFFLDVRFPSMIHAKMAIKEAIYLYNNKRSHLSIGYRTPQEYHQAELINP